MSAPGRDGKRSDRNNAAGTVAQASSPASFRTVPVPEPGVRGASTGATGGGTPPEPAAATAALQDSCNHNPLVAGFHFRGVLPHLKKEGGIYFVTFRQASALPKEVLLRFKHERDAILQQALAAKRPLTWHDQEELFR